jgi:fkuA protein
MTKTQGTKTLKFKYKSGTTAAGKDKYAQNTISKVDAAVSDEVIFAMLPLMAKVQEVASADVEVQQSITMK